MSSNVLAIDTATKTIGLALYNGIQVLGESVWNSQNHHTIELAPAIIDILTKSGLGVPDIGAIVISLGPGSFTGLRIGMGLAKGLSLANRTPLIGIPTLDSLAAAQPLQDMPLAAVLQAGRGRLAVARYHVEMGKWTIYQEVKIYSPQELLESIQTSTYICGELDQEQRRILRRKHKKVILASPAQSLRRPAYLAELGWQRWQVGDTDDPATVAPIYVHEKALIPE